MHHHGGGYSDIKPTFESWLPQFGFLDANPSCLASGYRETGPEKVAHINGGGIRHRTLRRIHHRLLGNSAFIFRPRTAFTRAWYGRLHGELDALLPALQRRPAREPSEYPGPLGREPIFFRETYRLRGRGKYRTDEDGYPVRWAQLLGEILQPLSLRYGHRLSFELPRPDLDYYR